MIQPQFSTLLLIYLFLLAFGILYNLVIAWLDTHGYLEGYTSLAVVAGVLVTLAGLAIILPLAALIALGAFAASGIPVIIGSIWRHVRNREQDQTDVRQTTPLAK